MVAIKPFKGLRYDQDKVKDFSLAITPPYDVINEKQKEEFYKMSAFNMARLILPESVSSSARDFLQWQKQGVLKQDEESIYLYSQEFSYKGKKYVRNGFISLVLLEDLGKGILPHEKTLDKPLKGRLELLSATKANYGSIFLLYDDRERITDRMITEICTREPDMQFSDKFQIGHKLWKVSDQEVIKRFSAELSKYQCVIADGHHRYKSALQFSKDHPEIESAKYAMSCFVNSFSEGLLVLPIDRFVYDVSIEHEKLLSELPPYFDVTEMESPSKAIEKLEKTKVMVDKTKNLKNHVFAMHSCANNKSYFLKLKEADIMESIFPEKSDVYRKLDVNILHKIVFEKIMGISREAQAAGTNIDYSKDPNRDIGQACGTYQYLFFINAPLMREIFLTARAGETMPQKSTFFYPKVYSGLVINKIA